MRTIESAATESKRMEERREPCRVGGGARRYSVEGKPATAATALEPLSHARSLNED